MANIDRNISIHGLANLLGERFLYRRAGAGKLIAANKPVFDENLKYAGMKKTSHEAFREAATHAAFLHAAEAYVNKARQSDTTAYSIALTDWFGAPSVRQIDVDQWTGRVGETIRVKARDNIKVAAVFVVIRAANGDVLEMGEALPSGTGSAWWNYTTRSRVNITPFPSVEAISYDLAGNHDSFVIN